ncbi:MAG: hypothetical protein ABW217_23900 [Polyangiaceae bacterium]
MNDLAQLADDVLLTSLKRLTGTANELSAQLLAHLAEVEARGIHRNMACATLYTYCVYELRMSEDEAQRRCRAARLCRQFPLLLEMLSDASIHLTGILLLGPHLTDDNHREVLARARYRTKREIEKLVAELAPRHDVPARIEPLHVAARPSADHATMMAALCGPVRNLPAGNGRGEAPLGALAGLELTDESSLPSPASLPEAEPAPARAMHYKVQFTADQEYMSLLEEARDLLAHVNPTRDFVEVQRRALELLVAQLRKRKHAARASAVSQSAEAKAKTSACNEVQGAALEAPEGPVARPGADSVDETHIAPVPIHARVPQHTRRPTAAVARGVWQRDGGRCSYVDARGQRCRETSLLEYHHQQAWALGGATTVDNISLRCRAHNALAAEQDFGREHMACKRSDDRETQANP